MGRHWTYLIYLVFLVQVPTWGVRYYIEILSNDFSDVNMMIVVYLGEKLIGPELKRVFWTYYTVKNTYWSISFCFCFDKEVEDKLVYLFSNETLNGLLTN